METTLTFIPFTRLPQTYYTSEADGLVFDTRTYGRPGKRVFNPQPLGPITVLLRDLGFTEDTYVVTPEEGAVHVTIAATASDIKRRVQAYWHSLQHPDTAYHFDVSDGEGGVNWKAVDNLIAKHKGDEHIVCTEGYRVIARPIPLYGHHSRLDKLCALSTLFEWAHICPSIHHFIL